MTSNTAGVGTSCLILPKSIVSDLILATSSDFLLLSLQTIIFAFIL
jgi:hypothetical protein